MGVDQNQSTGCLHLGLLKARVVTSGGGLGCRVENLGWDSTEKCRQMTFGSPLGLDEVEQAPEKLKMFFAEPKYSKLPERKKHDQEQSPT